MPEELRQLVLLLSKAMTTGRSLAFYCFMVPSAVCTAMGIYSIYDGPLGASMRGQAVKGWNYAYDLSLRDTDSGEPPSRRRPPPMPH